MFCAKGNYHPESALLAEPVRKDKDKPAPLQIHWEKGESYPQVRHKCLEAGLAPEWNNSRCRTNTSFYREIPSCSPPASRPLPSCFSIYFSKTLTWFSGQPPHTFLFLGCSSGAPLSFLFSPYVAAGWSHIQQISLCRWQSWFNILLDLSPLFSPGLSCWHILDNCRVPEWLTQISAKPSPGLLSCAGNPMLPAVRALELGICLKSRSSGSSCNLHKYRYRDVKHHMYQIYLFVA